MPVFLLDELNTGFPHPRLADPDGLLAVGGDLSIDRLLVAYQNGIFPWYNEDDPPMWWCPDPRYVIFPSEVYVSKTMRQVMRRGVFEITYDRDFLAVMNACGSSPRQGKQVGSWITDEFLESYCELHEMGLAHSVEVWHEGVLAGGLYGVSLGKCFFGESMFTKIDNASKAALITLANDLESKDFWLIDCQMPTEHLKSLGAQGIPRERFLEYMHLNKREKTLQGKWSIG